MQEMIDLYDHDRNRLDITIPREGAFLTEGQFMLYVLAIIEAPGGRFLVTQRSLEKHWGAGWWEIPGGGVRAGETTLDAVRREVPEETGLNLGDAELAVAYSYENVDLARGDNYIVDIYHVHLDFSPSDVRLVDGEAIDFRLCTWEDICQLNEESRVLHFERIRQALTADGTLSDGTCR